MIAALSFQEITVATRGVTFPLFAMLRFNLSAAFGIMLPKPACGFPLLYTHSNSERTHFMALLFRHILEAILSLSASSSMLFQPALYPFYAERTHITRPGFLKP